MRSAFAVLCKSVTGACMHLIWCLRSDTQFCDKNSEYRTIRMRTSPTRFVTCYGPFTWLQEKKQGFPATALTAEHLVGHMLFVSSLHGNFLSRPCIHAVVLGMFIQKSCNYEPLCKFLGVFDAQFRVRTIVSRGTENSSLGAVQTASVTVTVAIASLRCSFPRGYGWVPASFLRAVDRDLQTCSAGH